MFTNKLYGAGKARDKRARVLRKLRIARETLPQRIEHGIEQFDVLNSEATEEQRKVHLRVLAEQQKVVKHLEDQLAIIEECETEITAYGFQLVDDFNGLKTNSTLTPLEQGVSAYSGTGECGHLSEGDFMDIRKTAEAIQKVREESPVPISPAEAYKHIREKEVK